MKVRSLCVSDCLMTSAGLVAANGLQARAVPVFREVKYTKVQRDDTMQNEQAWILLAVSGSVCVYSLHPACVSVF